MIYVITDMLNFYHDLPTAFYFYCFRNIHEKFPYNRYIHQNNSDKHSPKTTTIV